MPGCHVCGGALHRKKRNFAQRLVYRALYRCDNCGVRVSQPRSFFTLFRPYTECPRCGNHDLSRLAQKDRIDRTSPNPLRRILKLLGCPLYHCTFCRMQFRDWRRLKPDARPTRPVTQRSRQAFTD
jgi:uncharacterized Zn finger protein